MVLTGKLTRRANQLQNFTDSKIPEGQIGKQRMLSSISIPSPMIGCFIKCFLDMLGVFAELEANLRRERQLEGIASAKARGVFKGRKASIDPAKIKQMKAEGIGPSAVTKALKIGRASVYRALAE